MGDFVKLMNFRCEVLEDGQCIIVSQNVTSTNIINWQSHE